MADMVDNFTTPRDGENPDVWSDTIGAPPYSFITDPEYV
jgi:hypothetical protein